MPDRNMSNADPTQCEGQSLEAGQNDVLSAGFTDSWKSHIDAAAAAVRRRGSAKLGELSKRAREILFGRHS